MVPNGRFVSAFVKPDGPQIDRGDRLSPDLELQVALLSDRVKVLTKTECPEWNNKDASKHTSYFSNSISRKLAGTYENWVFAHPVKDRCLTTYKCTLGDLDKLVGMGLLKVCWGDPAPAMGASLPVDLLGIGRV